MENDIKKKNTLKIKNNIKPIIKTSLSSLISIFLLQEPLQSTNISTNTEYIKTNIIKLNTQILSKIKLNNININNFNNDTIKLFQKDKEWEKFLFDLLKLRKTYKLSMIDMLNIFRSYTDNGIIPEKLRKNFKTKLGITYNGLVTLYTKKELARKLKIAEIYYNKWQLNKNTIKYIFPDYEKKMQEKEKKHFEILINFLLLVVIILLNNK